jgi:hypothetical protein
MNQVMSFQWDDGKAASNWSKQGFLFMKLKPCLMIRLEDDVTEMFPLALLFDGCFWSSWQRFSAGSISLYWQRFGVDLLAVDNNEFKISSLTDNHFTTSCRSNIAYSKSFASVGCHSIESAWFESGDNYLSLSSSIGGNTLGISGASYQKGGGNDR